MIWSFSSNSTVTLLPPLPIPLSHTVLLTGESFLPLHPLCPPHLPPLQTAACHWGTDTSPAPATPPDFIFLPPDACPDHHHQLPAPCKAPCWTPHSQPSTPRALSPVLPFPPAPPLCCSYPNTLPAASCSDSDHSGGWKTVFYSLLHLLWWSPDFWLEPVGAAVFKQ